MQDISYRISMSDMYIYIIEIILPFHIVSAPKKSPKSKVKYLFIRCTDDLNPFIRCTDDLKCQNRS